MACFFSRQFSNLNKQRMVDTLQRYSSEQDLRALSQSGQNPGKG